MRACLKSMAERGAVGKTARWAAYLYHRWRRLAPESHVDLDSLVTVLIATRYDIDALVRPHGPADAIRTSLGILQDSHMIHGLCHLVVLILEAESGVAGGHCGIRPAYIGVIGEELIRAGVPVRIAFGEDPHSSPQRLRSVYSPSMQMLRLLL